MGVFILPPVGTGSLSPTRSKRRRDEHLDAEAGLTLNGKNYAASTAGTGNAVTDLIFSMANRDVTFFNGTAAISFL
jgi:hypothetical protein